MITKLKLITDLFFIIFVFLSGIIIGCIYNENINIYFLLLLWIIILISKIILTHFEYKQYYFNSNTDFSKT